ncbi:hypothetical protein METBIDRAFT_108640 [Metschnikowia bicuspidata var. bicuspidata NRRL YB-4993]|uniref:Uncharacterized protein n=1 Tax=Metschnikowia bicuspidata var. bicuspidata NRRL YB-4993 TaxID=869754 RepID=A0A1A0HHD2_9ASCO|nr:hypothetical protein METBIDRAFT_108640 [Metschnikowia bicuspidata var. bicuspidata NRRL YB-4993]OBA23589.1 hypothetical protein METBIDRAFT_108640 [Metschnikowia bicuspidata var. bicuspidata NRRL YB-4993]
MLEIIERQRIWEWVLADQIGGWSHGDNSATKLGSRYPPSLYQGMNWVHIYAKANPELFPNYFQHHNLSVCPQLQPDVRDNITAYIFPDFAAQTKTEPARAVGHREHTGNPSTQSLHRIHLNSIHLRSDRQATLLTDGLTNYVWSTMTNYKRSLWEENKEQTHSEYLPSSDIYNQGQWNRITINKAKRRTQRGCRGYTSTHFSFKRASRTNEWSNHTDSIIYVG